MCLHIINGPNFIFLDKLNYLFNFSSDSTFNIHQDHMLFVKCFFSFILSFEFHPFACFYQSKPGPFKLMYILDFKTCYFSEVSLIFTFFPSRSCAPCSRTLSTPDTSAKVTKPKPLQVIIMIVIIMIQLLVIIKIIMMVTLITTIIIIIIITIIIIIIIIITLICVWWGPSSPSPQQSPQTWQNTPSAPLQKANFMDGQI